MKIKAVLFGVLFALFIASFGLPRIAGTAWAFLAPAALLVVLVVAVRRYAPEAR